VQLVLEQRALELARELKRRVPSENLCVAGLLADNTRLCARLATESPFARLHVPGAPYKSGGALGAASFAARALDVRASSRGAERIDLGEAIDARGEEGARELGGIEAARHELGRRLAGGEVVGWVRGRMEFTSRSLGHRVALVHAAAADARSRLLSSLRHVEPFLTSPAVLPWERAHEFLEGNPLPLDLAQRSRVALRASPALRALAPAAVHADGRVWPRLVAAREDPELHALLLELGGMSGVPCLLMTDLAVRGSPVVRNEEDAVEALRRSSLAALVAGTRLYEPR
jgi:carbamoyltransferase